VYWQAHENALDKEDAIQERKERQPVRLSITAVKQAVLKQEKCNLVAARSIDMYPSISIVIGLPNRNLIILMNLLNSLLVGTRGNNIK